MLNLKKAVAWLSWQLTKLRHPKDEPERRKFRLHTHPYGRYVPFQEGPRIVRPLPKAPPVPPSVGKPDLFQNDTPPRRLTFDRPVGLYFDRDWTRPPVNRVDETGLLTGILIGQSIDDEGRQEHRDEPRGDFNDGASGTFEPDRSDQSADYGHSSTTDYSGGDSGGWGGDSGGGGDFGGGDSGSF